MVLLSLLRIGGMDWWNCRSVAKQLIQNCLIRGVFLVPNLNDRIFLRDSRGIWLRGDKERFSPIDETTWLYINLGVEAICETMLKIMKIFGLSEEEVLLKVKQ